MMQCIKPVHLTTKNNNKQKIKMKRTISTITAVCLTLATIAQTKITIKGSDTVLPLSQNRRNMKGQ